MNYLFVYGSLRKHFHNHYLLEKASFVGYYNTKETYFMTAQMTRDWSDDITEYPPYMPKHPYITTEPLFTGQHKVNIYGELYLVNDELLKQIDRHEGVPYMYNRSKIMVSNIDEVIQTNIYILENKDQLQHCKAMTVGDWQTYRNTRYLWYNT
jgi:gamma-glutamylcyclotransferase (GGCT)/AIG2-like uncharacterized protein YtfP